MTKLASIIALILMSSSQSAMASGCSAAQPADVGSTFPSLNGRLMYESYVKPGDGSGQLWMLDFATAQLQQLSNSSWGIIDPTNPVFSVDGNWILFMGVQNNATNIFVYRLGSSAAPVNLTNSTGATKNEDPKFSADGTQIVFKQTSWPGGIASYSILEAPLVWSNGVPQLGNAQTLVAPSATEVSMPFLSPDSSTLYYTKDSGTNEVIWSESINPIGPPRQNGGRIGNPAFYPIVRDDYAVLFAKWVSYNLFQIVIRPSGASAATTAPFNDATSETYDPWPVNGTNYVFYSSNSAGPFNLYVGDAKTGQCWSLTGFGVNSDTTKGKFAASYR